MQIGMREETWLLGRDRERLLPPSSLPSQKWDTVVERREGEGKDSSSKLGVLSQCQVASGE